MFQHKIQFFQVSEEILHPERGAFSDGHKLGGLIMGIPQRGRAGVFLREPGKIPQKTQKPLPEVTQALTVNNQVRVIGNVAACRAQMDDPGGGGGGFSVGVDMSHHIVSDFLFFLCGKLIINVVNMRLKLCHLFRGDRQTQDMLRPCQGNPEPPPGLDTGIRGKELQHKIGSVTGRKRRFVAIFRHKTNLS